jgi:hypothetical protein
VVEAGEVKSLAFHGQVHDPGLGRLRPRRRPASRLVSHAQRGLGLLPGLAAHHQVIGLCRLPDYAERVVKVLVTGLMLAADAA